MAEEVTGEMYYDLDGQLAEIKRQMRQRGGYPYDPRELKTGLQRLIEGKFQFDFEHNKHGHIIVTATGLGITGAEVITRLEVARYNVHKYAEQCFTLGGVYDAKHRREAGRVYRFALVPGKEIPDVSDRTTQALRELGMGHYGYGDPFGEDAVLMRKNVSDEQMEGMGLDYIASLHDPIEVGGYPGVLYADRRDDGRKVGAYWDKPGNRWRDYGAFTFPLPENYQA